MAADLQTEDGQDANLIRHPNAFGHAMLGSPSLYMAGGYPLGSGYNTPYVGSTATSVAPSVASPSSSLHESDSPKEEEEGGSSRRSSVAEDGRKEARASGLAAPKENGEAGSATPPEPSTLRSAHTPGRSSSQFPCAFDDSAPTSPDPANKRRRLSSSASQNPSQLHLWHSNNYPTPSALRSQLLAPPPHATNVYLPHGRELDYAEPAGTTVPNLIGALHTNAFKLKDDKGEKGIFFIFHDLSVRTEGRFRLRLRFLSVGAGGARTGPGPGSAVAAHVLSQPFTVSSAKKFEGMMDPTPLSQCMAKQGVRIPTRKVARTKSTASGASAGPASAKRKARGGPNGEEDELDDDY